ncbi:MAG: immunoglobulin domain-containing protein [Verrucomicrobia bacterium]|nr:immunoglobulin domain-containing protein [Verrucomicrobiota bacterium]MCH8510278.1 immunoglobulin domain-containing protein [Kiritimatiellia bacterium]
MLVSKTTSIVSFVRSFILFFGFWVHVPPAVASDRVFYVGESGETRFYGHLPLSDGTILVGGAANDLAWVPAGTAITEFSTTAANGSSIKQDGVSSGKTAFVLRLNEDASQILSVLRFPHNQVHNITFLKTDTPTGETTGNLYISGQRGGTGGDGGYFIARLNNNFLGGAPTGMDYVWNINTRGRNTDHGVRQPWDVMSDGRIVAQTGRPYEANWGEIIVLPAEPGTQPANSLPSIPMTVMPGFRVHTISDGANSETFYGTEEDVPPGYNIVASRMMLKTQQTNASGLQRSFTPEDFHRWQRDENGYWRRGTYPLDAFWRNYWTFPEGGDNNMWGGDARGYTGYKLAGTGSTEGSPYTPRVGAITVDKRNDRIYIGLNWQSRLPATNNPDFEPALIVLDSDGYMQWWARLYQEYNDTSDEGPQNIPGDVDAVPDANRIQVDALVGESLNLNRKTSGSDGFINGYRRLYWMAGSANVNTFSRLSAFDPATGTLTFVDDPANPVQPGDAFLIDGTEMTRTHTSTPDQYIDAIAIDYSTPLDGSGHNGIVYVGARAHGNNVVSFWKGHEIAANPGGNGFVNQFTGSFGNIHLSWLGKYRDEGDRSTILASTFVGEYVATSSFGDGNSLGGTDRTHPNHDFWPNQNGGWPDRNSTGIGGQMAVNELGQVVVYGNGRTVQTTANAYQRNIRPYISGTVSAASSASEFTAENMIGANLILTNCRVRINVGSGNEIRQVVGFDNETGTLALAEPLSGAPNVGTSFRIDEGEGNWGNFVRVYSSDLSRLEYSTLLSSAINPVDGSGTNSNSAIFGAWPVGDRILVSGYHENADGNAIPTANPPVWGNTAPIQETDTAFFAVLSINAEPPEETAPEILQHPVSQTVNEGENVEFSVVATGHPSPEYQWFHEDEPLPGANESVLQLQQVTEANAGTYHVVVSNGIGTDAVSDGVLLTVTTSDGGGPLTLLYAFTHDEEGFSPVNPVPNLLAGDASNAGGLNRFITNETGAVDTLSTVNNSTRTDVDEAYAHDEYFTITLSPNQGYGLNLQSLAFKVSRGGSAGIRNYAVRSSLAPEVNLIGPKQPVATRGSWDEESIDLGGPDFQNLREPVTFIFIVATDATGRSLEWDDITFEGTLVEGAADFHISVDWHPSGTSRILAPAASNIEYLLEYRETLNDEGEWLPVGDWQTLGEGEGLDIPDPATFANPSLFLRARGRLKAD